MHVEVRQTKDVVILDLKGRLTAGLGDQILRDAIDELLAEGRRRILLNLSEVSFVDSAGVGELVAGLKTARRFGADLKLLNVGDRVYSTLDMARLLPTFETYRDETEAVLSFGPACAATRAERGSTHSPSSARVTAIGSRLVTRSSTAHSGQLIVSPTSRS